MSELNPAWFMVVIGVISMVGSWVMAARAARHGTEVALARFEERQLYQGEDLRRLRNDVDEHADLISDHETRLAIVEKVIDFRPPPRDFPVRG